MEQEPESIQLFAEDHFQQSIVTDKQVIKARKELLKRFKRVDKSIELFCPYCHRGFFIET